MDYDIPDYTLHPVNLDPSSKGRGIAVFTHSSIEKSTIQIQPDLSFEEACLLEIRLRGGDNLLFGCFYRSPTGNENSELNNNRLNDLLRTISSKRYSHCCILGDFNYRSINWEKLTTPHREESQESRFLETTRDCFLHQHICEPTRRRGQDEPSLLDLLFTDEVMQVSNITHHAPLGKSDHSVISFKFHCYLDYTRPKDRYAYDKADFQSMRDHLNQKGWKEDHMNRAKDMNKDDQWNSIKTALHEMGEKFVPKITSNDEVKPKWKTSGSIPIGKPLQEAIREKNQKYRRWMRAKCRNDADKIRSEYSGVCRKVKRLMRKAKRDFEKNICKNPKENPKRFWWYVRHKLKTKSGVAPLLANVEDRESMKFDDQHKANILQQQFPGANEFPVLPKRTQALIRSLKVTETMVRLEILRLNINKSCGPDNVHPIMLIEPVDILAGPLTLLLNKTIEEGDIPADWKSAWVSPVFKKGSKSKAENYRPISLTSIVCKLMETFVKDAVLEHLVTEKLLSTKQFGFIPGRSTVTQLLQYLDKCCDTIAKGGVVDTIYLDFQKAFDTVPHRRLLGKLESYGISGDILAWISGFLSGRSQIVKVNGVESASAPVLSGIPQGSVLGPLLFVIYINDLPDTLSSNTLLLADDTKVFRRITSKEDGQTLQADIDALQRWSDKWLLRFHPDKCHVLTLGKVENIRHTFRYTISKQELEHVFEEKDLGILIDNNLRFEEHISSKVHKANAIVGLIRRTFNFLDCKLFKQLYTTFVRPHLEYGQAVWSPFLKKQVDMVENVQIRATKLVDGLQNLEYSERLKILDLPTLVYRRARGDMIEVFKHIHSYDTLTISSKFRRNTRPSRQHKYQLTMTAPNDGERGPQRNSFYYRTVNTWNNLPKSVVEAGNINSFKNELDSAWKNAPWRFDHTATSDS